MEIKLSRKGASLSQLDLNTVKHGNLAEILTCKFESSKDISEIAREQQIQQIINDDQNQFDFYNIPTFDKQRLKKKNGTNFQSLNIVSDTQLVRGSKFFKKKKLDQQIQLLRQQIKNEPGKLQLLSEIYVQLEQNFENLPVISKQVKDKELEKKKIKEKNQLDMLELDIFSKRVKEERELQRLLQEEEERKAEELKRQKLAKGQNRRLSLIHLVKSQTQKLLQQQTKLHLQNSNQQITTNKIQEQKESTQQIPETQKSKTLMKMLSKEKSIEKPKDIQQEQNIQEIKETQDKQDLIQDFNKNLKGILDKDKKINTQNKNIDQDRNLRKKITQYMKGSVDIDADEQNQNSDFDYTPEGVRITVQAFYLNQSLAQFNTVVEKSKFYEKKSTNFDNKIQNKIQNCEAIMMNKLHTERILRLENHSILQKIREIKILLQSLEKELKILKKEDDSNKTVKQVEIKKFGLSSFLKKEQAISQFSTQQQLSQQSSSQEKLQASQSGKESRSNQIEDIMKNSQRQEELEDEIKQLKDSYKKFDEKIKFNNNIVIKMEQEVHSKKKELKVLKESQIVFCQEILKRGRDCRDEGLSWIIRKIFSMGEKVYDMYLPDFLDQRSREFLMNKAQKKMELEELRNIIESQLDIYKINVNIRKEEEKQMLLRVDNQNDDKNETDSESDRQSDISNINNNNSKTNINFDKSIAVTGSMHQGSMTLPSIKSPNSSVILNNTLSQIDINKIKLDDLHSKKNQERYFSKLTEGMEMQSQQIAEKTVDELNMTKLTTNDIIYDQTRKKINTTLKSWTKSKITDPNNKQQSIVEDKSNDNYISIPLPYRIILFENNQQLNQYTNREEFIKEYNQMQQKVEEKKFFLYDLEEIETQRIIKEFDFKQYATKFNIDCPTVLGALFGSFQADRLIIRFGMMHK